MGHEKPATALLQDPRTKIYTVRFSWAGQRYHRSTGTKNRGAAQAEAVRIVDEVMKSGRAPLVRGHGPSMPDLLGAWVESYAAGHSARTTRSMELYAERLFILRFPALSMITTASLVAEADDRLRVVKAATVKKELSALSKFLEWCERRGFVATAPRVPKLQARALGTPNTKRVQIRVDLSDEQVHRLLRALPKFGPAPKKGPHRGDETYPLRDVYRLIWETGLRIGTVERLSSPEHWRPGSSLLNITADIDKARYARKIPLTDAAREILDRHATTRGEGLIFGPRNSQVSLQEAARLIKLPEDLARRVGPHDLRHAAITHMANSGAPLADVAFLVGHKTITMTARYVHASQASAEAALRFRNGHRGRTPGPKKGRSPTSQKDAKAHE